MKFVSHRGAAGLVTENSAESFMVGAAFKPTYIETDLNRTSDGIYVLYHGKLRKTYTGGGLEETYDELLSRIPTTITLDELINLKMKVPLLIDIKIKNHYKDALEKLKNAPPEYRSGFTSPHRRPLATAQHIFPDAKIFISQPYQEGPFRTIQLALKYGFSGISLNKWWLGPITYFLCVHYKLDIMVYTVDRPVTMRLIHRFFSRVMICTNHPERFIRAIAKNTIEPQNETATT